MYERCKSIEPCFRHVKVKRGNGSCIVQGLGTHIVPSP
jgi:hypothetical protein